MFISKMTLLLLTAALASTAFADLAIGPAVVGYRATVGETARALDRSGNVAQTGTITNSAAVGGDLIQYIINVNEVHIGHLWSSAGSSHGPEYGDQTTVKTNSVEVRNSFVQYIIHDASFRNKIAKIVDNISEGGVASDYQAGEDQRNTITNSGAVKGANNRYSVYVNGLHMTKNEDVGDKFSMNDKFGTNPVSGNRRDPDQTGTITNSGAIERDLTQYIINMNDLTIDQIGTMSINIGNL